MHNLPIRSRLRSLLLAAALGVGTLAVPRIASANQYEVFIDIDTEEDLYDLKVAEVIDDDTFETLVDLLQRGVNLNGASRKTLYALPNLSYTEVDAILAYRDEVGLIRDPAELVTQGILRADKFSAIAAFLVLGGERAKDLSVSGMARMQTQYSIEDTGLPASAVQVRARGLQHATVGALVLNSRLQIGEVLFDPARQALTAEAPSDAVSLPKVFVQWEGKNFSAVAGTYRIGFGQRLTFDKTNHTDPDGFYGDSEVFRGTQLTRNCKESAGELLGSPCPQSEGYTYVTPDFRSRDGLLGVAASVHDLKIGPGTLTLSGFGSYQPRNIYQYELYNRQTCEDPRNDSPECRSPDVYRTSSEPLAQSTKYSFQTLPNMFSEQVLGGNATYAIDRRAHVGVTAYRSHVDWLVEGLDLDFQEWAPMPFSGDFGAVGVDAAKGIGKTDVLAEVTRSFDGMPGGGGMAGLLRTITAWDNNEIEVSARYYDENFANPHARPTAAADEFEGNRARNEIGGRVQYTGDLTERLRVRTKLDVWQSPSDSVNAISVFARGDLGVTENASVGLWTQYQDKNLALRGRGLCYVGTETDIGPDGPLKCAGQKIQTTARLRYEFNKQTWFDIQYQHRLIDDSRYLDTYRQDISLVGILTTKPHPLFRIRARSRFLYEDISDNSYLERSLWTYLDLNYRLRKRDNLQLRYDLVLHLDDRMSTATRSPSPEHWIRLKYEAYF